MKIIRLTNTTSTNDYLLEHSADTELLSMNTEVGKEDGEACVVGNLDGVCVVTDFQSAGKGMGTNTWESEEGKNLLFSILVHPTWLEAQMQYLLSMAEALALRDVLADYAEDITIKWPNDIYWKDRKISGTRIDGNIKGRYMSDMVIGTGININQQQFVGYAPNPVSLWQITGRENDRDKILRDILSRFEHYYTIAREEWLSSHECTTILALYHQHLYRREGIHGFADAEGEFLASIESVQPNGLMILQRTDGTLSRYEFKEVRFLLL